mgnify:CR=1 FL=1
MPIASQSARILQQYQERDRRESLARNQRFAETKSDERVLVARERIQAQRLEVALRKDRLRRAKLSEASSSEKRAVVEQHKGRKLALLHERPTKGMVREHIACVRPMHLGQRPY